MRENKNSKGRVRDKNGVVDIAYVSCQDCRFHENNPSFCKKVEAYVARKDEICELFKR